MTTVVILFIVTSNWFGAGTASELLRFDNLPACQSAMAAFKQKSPSSNFVCIDHVLPR